MGMEMQSVLLKIHSLKIKSGITNFKKIIKTYNFYKFQDAIFEAENRLHNITNLNICISLCKNY